MNRSVRRRSTATVFTAFGCFLLMATPAAASHEPHRGIAGNFEIDTDGDGTPDVTIDLANPGIEHPCNANLPDIAIDIHRNLPAWTFTINGITPDGAFFDIGAQDYFLDVTQFTGAGSWTAPGPPYPVVASLHIEADIYYADGDPTCAIDEAGGENEDGEACMDIEIDMNLTADYTGTATFSGFADVDGASTTFEAFGHCENPFGGFISGLSTITMENGEFEWP